jgi:hypothetical protein
MEVILITAGIAAIVSFWGWLAVSVVRTCAKIAELEQRMNDKDHQCDVREVGTKALERKVDAVDAKVAAVAVDTAFIRGKLEVAL